jgi:thimet oligopeptidase
VRKCARLIAIFLFAATAIAQQFPATQPSIWSTKPDAAAFEKSANERITSAQAAIARIVANHGPKTIANTLAPYDDAYEQLQIATNVATLMSQVQPDAAYRERAGAMQAKVAGVASALSLNRQVYEALSVLDLSQADAATRYYVQRQLLEFRLAGVDKDDATRAQLQKLNEDLAGKQSLFERNIANDLRKVEVASAAELDGLPQDYLDAHKPGPDGKIVITTAYPDLFPALTYARNSDLRRRLWNAFNDRAYPGNVEVLKAMMQDRYKIATLLGYASWADYNAADKMILNGKNIGQFLHDLDAATRPTAQREFALLLAERRKTEPQATSIGIADHFYWIEQVRRSQYNFDSQSLRPYLPFAQVKQGIIDTAASLFHVSFRQEVGAPGWDPQVETWDVLENNNVIGRFYLDLHPRPGKYTHDNEVPLLDGIRGKQLPEAALVCNFPEPKAGDPGLMDYDDAVTFFHEFGHLMHHILATQSWAGISGISMEADFAEAPSQMLEEWMRSPQVLAMFAKDSRTGQPIPADLVARMVRASAFARASSVATQTVLTAVSYDVYKSKPEDVRLDNLAADSLARYSEFTLSSDPEERHMYASFDHLAGYSSAYYTYMWDKVIAEDFFAQFDQRNLLAGDAPMRYRRTVLEPGGSMSANDLVRNFLGRPQQMAAFERWLSEEFAEVPGQESTKSH